MSEKPQIVWETRLDNRYDCRVERTDDYSGVLIMMDGETELLRESVGLSYQAMFGPDVADVATWQERLIAKIDKP